MAVEGETVVEEASMLAKSSAREDALGDHGNNNGNNGHACSSSDEDACRSKDGHLDPSPQDLERGSHQGSDESGTEEDPEDSDGPGHSSPRQEDPGGADERLQSSHSSSGENTEDGASSVAEEKQSRDHSSPCGDELRAEGTEKQASPRPHASADDMTPTGSSRPAPLREEEGNEGSGGAKIASHRRDENAETGTSKQSFANAEHGQGDIKEEHDEERAQDADNPDMALIASLVAAAASHPEEGQEGQQESSVAESEAYQQVLCISSCTHVVLRLCFSCLSCLYVAFCGQKSSRDPPRAHVIAHLKFASGGRRRDIPDNTV